jgi:spermidine synthase
MYNYSYFLPKLTTGRLKSSLYNRYKLLFYKDGLTATVTVTRNVRVEHQPLGITINGKYDGSSHEDMENQRLLAHVPLLFHPNPQKVAVVGMGTGCTAGSASLYGIDKLTVIEIEPAVIEGARLFTEYNHDVLNNPKVAFKTTDARLFFRLNADPYDVIISEPSNPWLAGPSDLFTLEFFQLTANSMKENALFCQWIQLYALSPENVKTIICTFTKVFPYTYLISSSLDNEILLLGAKTEFYPDILAARKRMEQKEIREDLADPNVDILNIFDLAARFRLGPKEIQQLVEEGAVNTDDLPVVAYQAPKELYIRTNEENMTLLSRFSKGIAPYIQKKFDSGVYKKDFFLSLAEAYRRYLKNSMEAIIAEECAGKVD